MKIYLTEEEIKILLMKSKIDKNSMLKINKALGRPIPLVMEEIKQYIHELCKKYGLNHNEFELFYEYESFPESKEFSIKFYLSDRKE